jgi:hypothetical protein
MALFKKLHRSNEAWWDEKFPRSHEPYTSKGLSITAPMRYQPKPWQDYVKTGKAPEPGSEQYVKMYIENPLSMGIAPLRDLEVLFGKPGTREARERLMMNIGPVAKTVLDILSGEDILTGIPITEYFGTGPQAHTGRLMRNIGGRATKTWNAMAKTMVAAQRPEGLIDIGTKRAVRNAWQGLEILPLTLMGRGEAAMPASPPGVSFRQMDPRRSEAWKYREGAKRLKDATRAEIQDTYYKLILPELFQEKSK